MESTEDGEEKSVSRTTADEESLMDDGDEEGAEAGMSTMVYGLVMELRFKKRGVHSKMRSV